MKCTGVKGKTAFCPQTVKMGLHICPPSVNAAIRCFASLR